METQKCQQFWSNTIKPTTTKPLFQLKQIETGGNLGHHYGNTKMSTGFRQSNHSNI
jgi:hypothetical protein